MRTKLGKDWAAQQMKDNGIDSIDEFLDLCVVAAQPTQ